MKRLLISILLCLLICSSALAGEKAVQVESLWSGITDAVGLPLSGGLVYTYQAGSDTTKATYTDNDKTIPAANPIVLDSEGKALIFADGLYKFVIKDSTGLTTLDTLDDLSYFNQYYTETVHASDYGDGTCTDETITAAQTAIGSDIRTLVLKPCTWVVDENTAINANVNLKLEAGAVLSIATGVTLTINGTLEYAPMHQVFSIAGTGKITPTQKYGKKFIPEMWGLNTTPGTTDMTSHIQNCINAAATAGTECSCTGYNLFSKLYLYYDVSLNPNFPQTYMGTFRLTGDTAPSVTQLAAASYTKGTILRSNDATGPAINIIGALANAVRAVTIKDISFVASNTTQIMKMYYVNNFVNLENVTMYQGGAGGGVLVESTWLNSWKNIYIEGAGKTTSLGVGLTVRALAADTGGGVFNGDNLHVEDFAKNWEFGHNTYDSGEITYEINCTGCESKDSSTYGVLIGHGIRLLRWTGSHIEGAEDGSNTGIGMLIKNWPKNVIVENSKFTGDIPIKLGESGATDDELGRNNVEIRNNHITANVKGIVVYGGVNARVLKISNNWIQESAAPVGNTYGIWIENVVQRGLVVEDNDIDTDFTGDIINDHRINVYRKIDQTLGYAYYPDILNVYDEAHNVLAWESGQHIITNKGATGNRTYSLPAAVIGMGPFTFFRRDADDEIIIEPDGTDLIRYTGCVAGDYLSMDTDYAKVVLRCITTGEWEVWYESGTLTCQ